MRILFISDIHGSLSRAQRVFSMGDAEAADAIVVLGDALYHGPRNPIPEGYDPKGVAEFLNGWQSKIIAVRGNCDSEVDQMVIDYPMMSDFSWVLVDGHRLFLTHGHLWSAGRRPALCSGDVLVFGHTHIPEAVTTEEIHVWNPGSCSLPKQGYKPSFGLYDERTFRVISLEDGETLLEHTI